ncbi:hypothetical protein BH11PSE8_BH11PSE8_09350 [soil metagenome]
MKMLFGVISLLIVLAIVGVSMSHRSRSLSVSGMAPAAGQAASDASASATPREQSRAIQQRVADDLAKAMSQADAARKSAEDK